MWLVPLALLGLLAWWSVKKLDWDDPWINLGEEIEVIGAKTSLTVKAGDGKSGLRELVVSIRQDGQEKVAFTRSFPPGGEPGREEEVPLAIEAKTLGLKEGKGTLTVAVKDRSWRNGFKGRTRILTRDVVIDLVPINLAFQSVNHLMHYGGTGLILYHLNKEVKESGVVVGGHLYRGFPNPKGAKGDYMVLFPIPLEPAEPYQMELVARPQWGPEVKRMIPLKLKPRRWRHDDMNLSEGFLRQVAATFSTAGSPVEAYLAVNREMRRADHDKIREVCRESRPEQLWSGAFQRFLGKPMARYGDKRTYIFDGKSIDQQVHLGEDLASLERSPVPAANHGVVVFAESLGIYGQAVILDHGLGVFSLYGHLSQIDVAKGDRVEKGQSVGRTGTTGLAGGDHLHFSMLLQGEFVDPREWWDPQWHKDQVQGVLTAQAPAAPVAAAAGASASSEQSSPRKGKSKRRPTRR
ncbi:MAG: M23 family metallopeptidase [Deltaproteobacteria bacterium]|nr:M23 family metallopeptidase [Deltaproteobacteria bacterium]